MKNVTVARVYLREGDKADGHNLMRELLRLLQDTHQVHGVTVFRGVAGFGAHGEVHADDVLRLNVHLPLVVEFYDVPDAVAAVLPRIRELVPAGHIVSWQAQLS
jgi:PII-like signaling protein